MMVFFRTKLGKILIWQKLSETWESNFKFYVGKISYSRMYHYINLWFSNIWSIASQILNQDRKLKYKILRKKQMSVGHKTHLKKLSTSVDEILVSHKTSFKSDEGMLDIVYDESA